MKCESAHYIIIKVQRTPQTGETQVRRSGMLTGHRRVAEWTTGKKRKGVAAWSFCSQNQKFIEFGQILS